MPIIKVNDLDMYYELHGDGIPLVLIAGYTGDHTFWQFMLTDLAKQFQVLIFDNRAIGRTKDGGKAFTLETMAADTIALIQQLELKKPHILGQSMGGAIAQTIAKQYPEEINKLIILNSSAKFNVRTQKVLEVLLNCLKENIALDLFLDSALPWFFSSEFLSKEENIKAFKQSIIDNPFPQTVQDQARQFNALLKFDSRAWLSDILSPALVIAAAEDIISLPMESRLVADGIPNANFVQIPGAHSSPVEQYQRVNEQIFQFLI